MRRVPETGIELITGRPGSGKSWYCTRRLIRTMIETRRPVYTNSPLKWRAVRTYLRRHGGQELAGLIHPLTEAHFNRFIERFAAMTEFLEKLKGTTAGKAMSERQRRETWIEQAGPNDCRIGPDDDPEQFEPNWIPSSAIIVIDEAHHWYLNPNIKTVVKKKEPPSLLTYLTMHRHMMHWIWFTTQAERQLSPTVHTLTNRVWEVHPRDDDQVVGPIRFGHLGIKALGYRCWSREQRELGAPPQLNFSVLPGAPWNRWVYRMYDSWTHAGSARVQQREMAAAREADGVAEGVTSRERKDMAWQRSFLGRTFRRVRKLTVLTVVLLVGVGMGRAASSGPDSIVLEASADDLESSAVDGEPKIILQGINASAVRLSDGARIRQGEWHRARQLICIDPGRELACWRDGDVVWVQRLGDIAREFGSESAVVERFGAFPELAGSEPPSRSRARQRAAGTARDQLPGARTTVVDGG
jgi:hypothetical protein